MRPHLSPIELRHHRRVADRNRDLPQPWASSFKFVQSRGAIRVSNIGIGSKAAYAYAGRRCRAVLPTLGRGQLSPAQPGWHEPRRWSIADTSNDNISHAYREAKYLFLRAVEPNLKACLGIRWKQYLRRSTLEMTTISRGGQSFILTDIPQEHGI